MASTLRKLYWYLRSPKDIEIGDDVDMRYYPAGSFDPVGIHIAARTAPTGQALIVDVKAAGLSLLFDGIQGRLPAGLTDHRSTNVATMKGQAGDAITLSLVQIGNQEPGRGITVEMTILEASPN